MAALSPQLRQPRLAGPRWWPMSEGAMVAYSLEEVGGVMRNAREQRLGLLTRPQKLERVEICSARVE